MKPIQIDITDKRVYAQTAFLVDSPTFLDLLEKVRTKFQIVTPFDSTDSWHNHLLKLAGYDLAEYWKMEKVGPDNKHWSKKSDWMKNSEANFLKMVNLEKELMQAVAKIRRLHHYPVLFDSVIRQAILFHSVTGFKTAMAILSYNHLPVSSDEDDPIMAIVVTPSSTKEDVLSAFDDTKKMRQEYEFTNPVDQKLDKDTLTNIERDRMWHWKKYGNGLKYDEILDVWNRLCPNPELEPHEQECSHCFFDKNKIEQAVSRYRKNLQLVIPKTDI